MAKIFVTGGCGYIGSCVASLAATQGHEILVLDDLSNSYFSASKLFEIVEGCISNKSLLAELAESFRPDVVLHFAALSITSDSFASKELYESTNVSFTKVVAETFISRGVPVVFASSAAVYDPECFSAGGFGEGDSVRPVSPYGQTKAAAEKIIAEIAKRENVSSVSLRFFNAAGAIPELGVGEFHNPETHLIPTLLRSAIAGSKKIAVYGNDFPTPDGSAIRDYIHVKDIANAFLTVVERIDEIKPGSIYNLGSSIGYSVKTVISVCERLLGSKFEVEAKQRRTGDSAILVANIEKARNELNWAPQYTVDEMVLDSKLFLSSLRVEGRF